MFGFVLDLDRICGGGVGGGRVVVGRLHAIVVRVATHFGVALGWFLKKGVGGGVGSGGNLVGSLHAIVGLQAVVGHVATR